MPIDSKVIVYGSLSGDIKGINPRIILFKNICL